MENNSQKPLLASKFTVPFLRRKLIQRPRLLDLLDSYADKKVIVVNGPAGFGKTTLISSWIDKKDTQKAWLSLHANDSSIDIFLSYLIKSLQKLRPELGETATNMLEKSDAPSIQMALASLINDLATIDKPSVLIVDDYHLVNNEKIHQALDFIIENSPAQLQVIIISRQVPGISVSRLRGQGRLVEITEDALRFNEDETGQFFREVMPIELSEEDVNTLSNRTEGWIAGIQLAALGLSDKKNSSQYIQEFSGDHHLVAEYLVDEVLAQQEEPIQNFLIDTSFLDEFSAPLCNAILDIENAWSILDILDKENLFLITLDDKNNWFRYHHLFGDMLRSKLKRHRPEYLTSLYTRAVDWHIDQGLIESSINYAIEGSLFDRAVELMSSYSHQFQTGLGQTRLSKWLRKIPLETLREHDDFWLEYNLSFFYFSNFERSLEFLRSMETEISSEETKDPIFESIQQTLKGTIALHTTLNAPKVLNHLDRAIELSPNTPELVMGIAYGHCANAHLLLGDIDTASAKINLSIENLKKTVNWPVTYVFLNTHAEILASSGQLHQAYAVFCNNHQNALVRGIFNAIYLGNLIGLGSIEYEWNRLEDANEHIQAGQDLIPENRTIDRLLLAGFAILKLQQAQNVTPQIEKLINHIELEAAKYNFPIRVMDRLDSLVHQYYLALGDFRSAYRWAHTYSQRYHQELGCLRQQDWLVVSQIWIETGNFASAINILESLMTIAHQDNRLRDWVTIRTMLANALVRAGEMSKAEKILSEALTVSASEGFIRSYIDQGEAVMKLITELHDDQRSTHYQSEYLASILNNHAEGAENQASSILTPRELEVLHLLAAGLRYSQIAENLVITENTLKFHIKNIYSKLAVSSRTQAVIFAQEKSLL